MSTGFPTNTIFLIVIAMIGLGVSVWFTLSQALKRVSIAPSVRRMWSWGVAIVLSVWLFVRLELAVNPPGNSVIGVPLFVAFIVFGLSAGILPLVISPVFRQIIRSTPATWLVGIHTIRAAGFLFLALLDMKLLPPEFALPAGYGDMMVGLLALAVIYSLAKRKPYARALTIAWNILGLLDFITALTTGNIYLGPFASQLTASGISPLYLNYVLIIPTFAVPLLTVLHLYSLVQMLSPHEVRGAAYSKAV